MTIAEISSPGVTSASGLAARVPAGAVRAEPIQSSSWAGRSSIGSARPSAVARSTVQSGAATTKGRPCRALTAPLDVRLFGYATKFEEDPNVVQPDIVVICDEDKVDASGRYEGIPTLIVEVLSPTTKGKDLATKLHLYMRSGVAEYWVVDPERKRISQYVFTPDRDINHLQAIADGGSIESAVLQGLAVSLGEIWP